MSGGALNYGYRHIRDLAEDVNLRATCPQHRAFAAHLLLVADAAYRLEWVLSADSSPGSETEAINRVLAPGAVLAQVTAEAKVALRELQAALDQVSE